MPSTVLPPLSPRARWAVPVVAAVVVAGAVAAPRLAAADSSELPGLTAQELVAAVAEAERTPVSGTVVYTARLGLPSLPIAEVSGADPTALLGGSSTMRVWSDGAERSRVALLGTVSEYSVVHDGPEAWTFSSTSGTATHYVLDAEGQARYEAMAADLADGTLDAPLPAGAPTALPEDLAAQLPDEVLAELAPSVDGSLPTPAAAARAALAAAELSATVEVTGQSTVADRAAYEVVVTPTSDGTLVDRVVLDVDGSTFVPLRVQVWSTQDEAAPALELTFTDVSFAAPSDAVLGFTPPADTQVEEVVVPSSMDRPATAGAPTPGVDVSGTGWDAVATISGVDVPGLLAADPAALVEQVSPLTIGSERAQDLVEQFRPTDEQGRTAVDLDAATLYETLTTEVEGGRLLTSTLLSVLVTDDGRVLVGAVPPQTLLDLA
ncbi:LolA family protein [Cellulomonas endophytica]|uniref:LolA family protein n=1 Tax=Cellulomonas endophytica TaxID=2494735 RepID=UPI0010139CB0|nr:hypothetical protein [Cellulomonas endophytica]